MACCILAAFLWAHFRAMLRRWGMYWGVVEVPQGVVYPTIWARLATRMRRPAAPVTPRPPSLAAPAER